MLLACAGIKSGGALEAITALLRAGAVPDTWAPNGSSALMLAAAVDSVDAIVTLLDNGATVELQVPPLPDEWPPTMHCGAAQDTASS